MDCKIGIGSVSEGGFRERRAGLARTHWVLWLATRIIDLARNGFLDAKALAGA